MVNNPDKGCFPCDSVVTVDGQKKPYKDLKVGDLAKVVLDDGNIGYSEVWCISHHNPDTEAEYIQVDTESKRLVISKRHFVSVKINGQLTARMAEELKVGDDGLIICDDEGKLTTEQVVALEQVTEMGICNVFTKTGRLFVNDVLCWCYAEVNPRIVHPILAPLRTVYDITPTPIMEKIMTPNSDGKPYLLKTVSSIMRPLVPF